MLTCTLLACNQVSENKIKSDEAMIADQMDTIEELVSAGVSTDSILTQYLELFIDDPVLIPPGRSVIQGRDSALGFYKNAFSNIEILDVVYEEPVILIDGDMAARRFTGTTKIQIKGQVDTLLSTSRYVDVLQKQPDGKWRIAWHAWEQVDW
ncbi:YybH family protein [Fodinibius saliphilus]|uniref:YybH family protein n=1 Tax=Fodinibius saliphilus TaxID=1920650 RepID=UPI001485F922|nr:nuclear transport factor 2 family protein [Fodinibius saliphilus]